MCAKQVSMSREHERRLHLRANFDVHEPNDSFVPDSHMIENCGGRVREADHPYQGADEDCRDRENDWQQRVAEQREGDDSNEEEEDPNYYGRRTPYPNREPDEDEQKERRAHHFGRIENHAYTKYWCQNRYVSTHSVNTLCLNICLCRPGFQYFDQDAWVAWFERGTYDGNVFHDADYPEMDQRIMEYKTHEDFKYHGVPLYDEPQRVVKIIGID